MIRTQEHTLSTSTLPINRRGSRSKPLWYWILLILLLVVITATAVPAFTQRVHRPGLEDLFLKPIFGEGTIFQFDRLVLIRIAMAALVSVILLGAAAKATLAPGHGQMAVEFLAGFIRDNVAIEILGPKKGRAYVGFIGFALFATLAMSLAGVIPGTNIAATSVAAVPAVFTIISYVTYVGSSIKALGLGRFFASQLLPPGSLKPIYLLITPIESLSNFIVRPVTPTVRFLANTMAGHLLFGMTYFGTALLLQELSALSAAGTLIGVAIFVTTGFEVSVAFLQAYIFTILTPVYIKLLTGSH